MSSFRFWPGIRQCLTSRTFFSAALISIYTRCFGQESSCENISLGSCLVEQASIIKTLPVPPTTCDTLCEVDDNCEFWKARNDGTLCQLLKTDYQHVSSSCFFVSAKSIRKKTKFGNRIVNHLLDPSPRTWQTALLIQTLVLLMSLMTVHTLERG